jgi:predicted transcriptional regulator
MLQLAYVGGEMGDSQGRKTSEQSLVQTIVVLIRNTTWRCGKLEKSIVKHLYKRHENFGKHGVTIRDIMQNLNITGEKKDECLDALKRLEKRNIVKILPL